MVIVDSIIGYEQKNKNKLEAHFFYKLKKWKMWKVGRKLYEMGPNISSLNLVVFCNTAKRKYKIESLSVQVNNTLEITRLGTLQHISVAQVAYIEHRVQSISAGESEYRISKLYIGGKQNFGPTWLLRSCLCLCKSPTRLCTRLSSISKATDDPPEPNAAGEADLSSRLWACTFCRSISNSCSRRVFSATVSSNFYKTSRQEQHETFNTASQANNWSVKLPKVYKGL